MAIPYPLLRRTLRPRSIETGLRFNDRSDFAAQFSQLDFKEYLRELPESLDGILRLRFGWHDGKSHTLQECGWRFLMTRQGAEQAQKRAFNKLRAAHSQLSQFTDHHLGFVMTLLAVQHREAGGSFPIPALARFSDLNYDPIKIRGDIKFRRRFCRRR